MASVKQPMLCLPMAEDEPVTGDGIEPRSQTSSSLMARVLDRDNLIRALKQVKRNKGAPGIDGMTVDQFPDYLKHYWPTIRHRLQAGTYRPRPVRRVAIPKPDGRQRKLGIPTVLDRFIQQDPSDNPTPWRLIG
jgi:RNA-directed DNA polymerase